MLSKNRILYLFMALTTAGCLGPSPKFENGHYTDYRRKVCFATPESWRQVKEVPEAFLPRNKPLEEHYRQALGSSSDVIFENAKGTAIIVIEIDQSFIDVSKLPSQKIKNIVEAVQASRKQTLGRAPHISDYRFSATPNCVTEKPLALFKEQFNYTVKKPCAFETQLYVFTIDKEDTGSFRATLFSEAACLKENRLALDRLLKTIKRIGAEQSPG